MLQSTHVRARSALAVGILGTLMFSGCGLKGPLYRTDENGERIEQPNGTTASKKKPPFERVPAPQAQKDESGTSSPAAPPSPTSPTSPPAPVIDPDRPATPTPTP